MFFNPNKEFMRSTLTLLFLFLFQQQIFAQATVAWTNYPGGACIAVSQNESVYTISTDANPGGDILLTKRNSSGTILWDTAYNNTDATRYESATWVETDFDENIVVCGTIISGFSNPVNAASVVMKFDSTGALLWRVVYENSFDGSSTKKVLVDSMNNIYVFGLGMGSNGMVCKVKKFDPSGNPLWNYFDTAGIGAPLNMKFTPDGHLLLVGRSITGSMNGFSKIDLNGNLIWHFAGIQSNITGDAAGDSFGNTFLTNGEYQVSNAGSIITKLSTAGIVLDTDTNAISAYRIEVGTDDQALICGFPNSGMPGAAFMKYDNSLNLLWQNLDADGPSFALLLHAQLKLDVNNAAYLAAGTLGQMAVCKINSDGSSAWTISMPTGFAAGIDFISDSAIYVVGGTTAKIGVTGPMALPKYENSIRSNELAVYPNPATQISNVSFNSDGKSNYEIRMQNMNGRIIYSKHLGILSKGNFQFDLPIHPFPMGIYLVQLISNNGVETLQLIKQ
jgi:hypothetical protein